MQGNNNAARAGIRQVSVQEFAAKYKTKREVYNFLTVDCRTYEPPIQCVTVWHLRDQAMGAKGMVSADAIKHLAVPVYGALSMDKILLWAKAHCPVVVERQFPIERELDQFPRQYVINVLYTIVGEPFAAWVKEQVEVRNAKVKEEETIDLEAAVAEAFFRSTAVSQSPGTSHHLMKPGSKRRRTKEECKTAKVAAANREQEYLDLKVKVTRLEDIESQAQIGIEAKDAVESWLKAGLAKIDEHGKLVPVIQSEASSQGSRNVQANLRSRRQSQQEAGHPAAQSNVDVQLEDINQM